MQKFRDKRKDQMWMRHGDFSWKVQQGSGWGLKEHGVVEGKVKHIRKILVLDVTFSSGIDQERNHTGGLDSQ